MPLATAVGITMVTVATIAKSYYWVPVGTVVSAIALIAWLVPSKRELAHMLHSPLPAQTGLPIMTTGSKSLGWLGLMFLLAVLATVFMALFYCYFYLRLYSRQWPQDGVPLPDLRFSAPLYALIPIAAALAGVAWCGFRQGRKRIYQMATGGGCVLAVAFLSAHLFNLFQLELTPQTNAYGSMFFLISWTVDLVVLVGLGMAGTAFFRSCQRDDDWQILQALHCQMNAHFSYFSGVTAVCAYAVLYLSPRLI